MSWFDYTDPEYVQEINVYLFKHQKRQEEKKPTRDLICKCPVCKSTLGYKPPASVETLRCEDCKSDYTFYGAIKIPTGKPDSLCKKSCNCPACKARRGEKESDSSQIEFKPDWDESDLP